MCNAAAMSNLEQHAPLTSAEVCETLNIDRSTLSRWVAAGLIEPSLKLPGIRGAFIFNRDEVERRRQEMAAS